MPTMSRGRSVFYLATPGGNLSWQTTSLMEWRSDGVLPPANPDGFPVNDVGLLTAMEGVLASGCKRLQAASLFHHR
jgi:hypothetical protein